MAGLQRSRGIGSAVGGLALLYATGCGSAVDEGSSGPQAAFSVGSWVVSTAGSSVAGETDEQAQDHPAWQRALGSTAESVSSSGVAADGSGSALVTGYTLAEFDGSPQPSSDAFVAKYSPRGELLWSRQLGTPGSDASAGVSLDLAGNVFIAGDTAGALDGAARGFGDSFVARYSAAGELEWTRQLGTSKPDAAAGVSADAHGNVFVTGFTRGSLDGARSGVDADAWVLKYSPAGELLWSRQIGSARGDDDLSASVRADPEGNVLIAGHSFGPIESENQGSADAFVAKFSATGDLLWIRQRGAAGYDAAEAVSTDSDGNVVVSGQMGGVLTGGPGVVIPGNPYVAKYSPEGELLWELQLADAAMGSASSNSADRDGSVFIAGYTSSSWGGPQRGLYDSFVTQLSPDGDVLWALNLGVEDLDRATGVSADGAGHLFLSSDARNAASNGSDRAFLTRRLLPDAIE